MTVDNIIDSIKRMESTKSIGNKFEWVDFKDKIFALMAESKKICRVYDEEKTQLKADNRKLRVGLTSAIYSNKKHVEDKAVLKKALSVLLNDSN